MQTYQMSISNLTCCIFCFVFLTGSIHQAMELNWSQLLMVFKVKVSSISWNRSLSPQLVLFLWTCCKNTFTQRVLAFQSLWNQTQDTWKGENMLYNIWCTELEGNVSKDLVLIFFYTGNFLSVEIWDFS